MYALGIFSGVVDLVGRLFRSIWYFLDHTIYSWVPKLYNALVSISRTSPLSQADIADMADRIYKLLAVFMVFKVTFSLIMYIVNPDDFSDKNKGVSKLITNIVISLALLVLTPYIFSYAFQFQVMILKNNTLATVIFGKDLSREGSSINNVGDQIAFIAMSPFLTPDLSQFPKCRTLYNIEYDNNGKAVTVLNDECFGFKDIDDYASNAKNCDGTDTLCYYVCDKNGSSCDSYGFKHSTLVNYAAGIQRANYHMFFKKSAIIAMIEVKNTDGKNETEFVFDYSYILSTAVAVIILLFFITTCMDIGLRSIKLAFLQLIAPIPILSYIDPKSGKDGMFKKWYQMAFKTYLSLFIRLLALYFAIYVIGRLDSLTDIIDGSYISTGVVKVFIVIGALMFAKNFVKILEDLGIKLDGGFTLRPIKKFNDQALGGKRITGAAGALAAGTVDRAARLATSPWPQKLAALNPFTAGGQIIRGFAGNGGFTGGMKAQANVNRRLRESRVKGLSPTAAYLDYFGSKFGLDNATLEREGTFVQESKDNATKVKRDVEKHTVQKELDKDNLKKSGTVRNNAIAKHQEVAKQTDRLLKNSDDFITKKGDFDTSAASASKMALLKARIDDDKTKGITQIGFTDDDGTKRLVGLDEYYERTKRRINAKNYKTNRISDEANLQYLKENNSKALERSMMVGNEFFQAGTIIDDDMITRADKAKNAYIKESHKNGTNDMNTLLRMEDLQKKINSGGTLSGSEQTFYNDNQDFYNDAVTSNGIFANNSDDFNAFRNIRGDVEDAITAANTSVDTYNSEYTDEADLTGITYNSNVDNIYGSIKKIKGDMESGNTVTAMNREAKLLNEQIERLEREIEEYRRAARTVYVESDGTRRPVSLDEYDKLIKTREEELNDLRNRHRELINIHEAGK